MKKIFTKKLVLKKATIATLNSNEERGIFGGGGGYTNQPGDVCGRGDKFTNVAACPNTYACGNNSADCSPTDGPGGGGGGGGGMITGVNYATCKPKR